MHNEATTRMALSSVWLAPILILSYFFINLANSADQPERPSLAKKIGPSGSYHMMSEVEISDLKQRLIIEEWASFKTGQFRLDLVTVEERKTYLIYGDTGEIFRYQPFSCVAMEDHSDDFGVLSKMFKKFNLNQNNKNFHDTFIFGLGPLWMLADTCPTKKYLKAKEIPTKTRPELYNYHRFTVFIDQDSSDKDDFPFDLNFYFSVDDGGAEKSKSASNQNIGPIEMFEWIDDSKKSVARAKVIYLDTSISDELISSLFSIPKGYGCIRSNLDQQLGKSSSFIAIDYKPSHQMLIEVSASVPSKEVTQWTTHTAMVKFIRGSLGVDDTKYQIMETQERDDDVEPPVVKQVKKIWEYLGSNHNILYVIDEETNECIVSKKSDDKDATVEFASTANIFPSEIKLDLDTLNDLFITNDDDYHLIKDSIQPDGRSRVFVHERPLQKFTAGSLSGPASIVRTSVHMIANAESNGSPPGKLDSLPVHQNRNSAVIYIYSSDRRKLLGKLTFKLFDYRLVDSVILHKQLNIKNCLEESKGQYATIKYPMESPKISSSLAMKTDLIYDQFLTRMLNVMHLTPTNLNQLVINFDNYYMYIRMLILDTPSRLLRYTEIAGKTVDINYMAKSQQELNGVDIKRHVGGSADKCADICDTYQCKAFSYCNNRKCIIYSKLPGTVDDTLSDMYKDDQKCRVYVDDNNLIRHDNRPHHIIERIREIIKQVGSTSKDVNDLINVSDQYDLAGTIDYLSIRVPINRLDGENIDRIESVSLTPTAIETDMTDIDDYFKDLKHEENQLSPLNGPISIQHWLEDELVHAEYTLELEAKKFKLPIVDVRNQYSQANHITYEDCSIFCQSNNCLSFSYCEADQSCVISKMHTIDMIETEAHKDPHCNLFIRDYLSKFEKIPRVKRPYKSKWHLKANSARECAMNCMDSKTTNCLSFEFCSSLDENNANCYLHSFHGKSMTTEYDITSDVYTTSDKSKYVRSACDRYSRNYIADFDRFSGMELDKSVMMEAVNLHNLIIDIDTETCAKLCIYNEKCSGFTTCFDPSSSIKLSCMIAQTPLKRDHLNKNPTCNTNLLSMKSEFNTRLRHIMPPVKTDQLPSETALSQDNLNEDDIFSDNDQNPRKADDTTSEKSDYGWFSKIIILLIGAIIGCIFVHGYKNRSRLLQVIA